MVIMFELLQEYEARFHVGLPVEVPEVLPTDMFAIDLKVIKVLLDHRKDVLGLLKYFGLQKLHHK